MMTSYNKNNIIKLLKLRQNSSYFTEQNRTEHVFFWTYKRRFVEREREREKKLRKKSRFSSEQEKSLFNKKKVCYLSIVIGSL